MTAAKNEPSRRKDALCLLEFSLTSSSFLLESISVDSINTLGPINKKEMKRKCTRPKCLSSTSEDREKNPNKQPK